MDISGIIVLAGALLALILGWKPVTKMIGNTNLSFDQPAFNMMLSLMHLSFKLLLSVTLGYVFLIINIVKFIILLINRSNAKKTYTNNTQNTSEGNTTNEE